MDTETQTTARPAGKPAPKAAGKSTYVQLLTEICREEGITLSSWSSDWAFRLTKGTRRAFILGYQFGLNSSSSQQICTDKNIASEILRDSGVACVPHRLVMSPALLRYNGPEGGYRIIAEELAKSGAIVLKDNVGTGGREVYLARTMAEAEYAADQIFRVSRSLAVCPYREIREEIRVVMLDGEIRLAFRKIRPSVTGDGKSTLGELIGREICRQRFPGLTLPDADKMKKVPAAGEQILLSWKHNLGQGAEPRRILREELDPRVKALAVSASGALSVRFASVDIIRSEAGYEVLEVNSGVMMEHFASHSPEYRAAAKEIYRDAVRKMMEQP
ncbi:MAG: ATP-grasp domain-containing protein [Lachnospiraceae bacterium]|jgi:glutathione synthase/RimK-type ligase-like ATP-grasp enzyme